QFQSVLSEQHVAALPGAGIVRVVIDQPEAYALGAPFLRGDGHTARGFGTLLTVSSKGIEQRAMERERLRRRWFPRALQLGELALPPILGEPDRHRRNIVAIVRRALPALGERQL